jgi:hypothetical protein
MADSSSLLERVGGCSSPNNPFCLLGEPTTMNYGRTSRGELLHLLSVLMSGGSNEASFTFIPLCFTSQMFRLFDCSTNKTQDLYNKMSN